MSDTHGTVVLGFGPQPLNWFHNAMKSCGSDAVIDPDVARMAGVTGKPTGAAQRLTK